VGRVDRLAASWGGCCSTVSSGCWSRPAVGRRNDNPARRPSLVRRLSGGVDVLAEADDALHHLAHW
jgi:hypothetical protein